MENTEIERNIAKELCIPSWKVCTVGSTLICGAGKDIDILCLVKSEDEVEAIGFVPDIDLSYESPLRSFRRDEINLIATTDPQFFFAEIAIAHSAKAILDEKFDMNDRAERVKFHSLVRSFVINRLSHANGSF